MYLIIQVYIWKLIILWISLRHWFDWHAAVWINSSNLLQPLIQSNHVKLTSWEHCWVVCQALSLVAAQEKANQSRANHSSHLTSLSPSLLYFES